MHFANLAINLYGKWFKMEGNVEMDLFGIIHSVFALGWIVLLLVFFVSVN